MSLIKDFLFRDKNKANLDRFEFYRTYYDRAEAYIAKGVLETNGIKCFIEGDTLSSVYPSQLTFSGLRMFLRKADFLMADQLLGTEANALP